MMTKTTDVTALGELLIDFTESGVSPQGNRLLEVNPGGAPCNVLAMLNKLGHSTCFIGKIGKDMFGDLLEEVLKDAGIGIEGLSRDDNVNTTLAFVHTREGGDREFSFYRNPGADMMLSEDDIDPVLFLGVAWIMGIVPEAGRGSGCDRNAAFLFLGHPVHGGRTFMRLTDAVILACIEQDPLGGCRFSGIDMSHNTDVPDSVKWVASGHTGQLLLSTAA